MAKMLSDKDFNLDAFNPYAIAREIASRARQRRLSMNLTQQVLAERSGVSLGSVKRFENRYEISLKHLLRLAVVLDSTAEFSALFPGAQYQSIKEVLKASELKTRKRGRKNA